VFNVVVVSDANKFVQNVLVWVTHNSFSFFFALFNAATTPRLRLRWPPQRHTHTHFAQAKFDFAQYLIAFWRHEIVGLQEIAISTWGLFIAAFWLVVGTRYLVGGVTWNDTGYTTTAVGLNWLCFFAMLILVMEGFAARLALNDYVCEIVTGQKGSTVLDAMKHLSKISEGKTWTDLAQQVYHWL